VPSYPSSPAARPGDVAGTLRLLAYLALAITLIVFDHRGGWLAQVRARSELVVQPLWWLAGLPGRLGQGLHDDARLRSQLSAENKVLRNAGAVIHLVTAGIAQAIAPLAQRLGIRNVHAVSLHFDEQGNYADFDRHSLLARSGGKELVVRNVLTRSKGKSAFIGDGVTDLETKPVVDLFIGFGGVHERARVRDNAEVYVTEPTLKAVLPYLIES
jgi:phosphoserine phosphatase